MSVFCHFKRIVNLVLLLPALSALFILMASMGISAQTAQQSNTGRTLSGYILTQQNELLPNVTVIARSATAEVRTSSDAKGEFRLSIPAGPLTVRFEGKNVTPLEKKIGANDQTEALEIKITIVIAPIL